MHALEYTLKHTHAFTRKVTDSTEIAPVWGITIHTISAAYITLQHYMALAHAGISEEKGALACFWMTFPSDIFTVIIFISTSQPRPPCFSFASSVLISLSLSLTHKHTDIYRQINMLS